MAGPVGVASCIPSISQVLVVGEPVGKLFLWGHSSCALDNEDRKEIFVFGGFGGMGRHVRRNELLLLDPILGTLRAVDTEASPSPRLGHTSSLVKDQMFVIGGRADPLKILSDIWVFNTAKDEWRKLECIGNIFPPRHRHAAAVIGSKIYVFGGLNNETISSSLHVLETDSLQWKEILANGQWPCARHSHTMVAFGSKLFMFGGCNGEKALGDLYSFDVQTCLWKEEKVAGRSPHARFSHSMFVYRNFLGIVGGCPVRQNSQELALLDLQCYVWKHVALQSMAKELFVRGTASIVGDDLVMIGGGATCYAFGTKFSEPMKIDLAQIIPFLDGYQMLSGRRGTHVMYQDEGVTEQENVNHQDLETGNELSQTCSLKFEVEPQSANAGMEMPTSQWIVKLERKYAKLGKDILKKFGWLDLKRKVYSKDNNLHICFPVIQKFSVIFHEKQLENEKDCSNMPRPLRRDAFSLDELSSSTALDLLEECGAVKVVDEIVEVRKVSKSPFQKMNEAVASLIENKGLSAKLLEELPTRWERLGDIVVLPVTCFKDPIWDSLGMDLWPAVAKSLNTCRLACQGRVAPTGTRDSTLEILVGDNGWVDHRENGILYSFDATKCMFSWGNLSEKVRMGCLDCRDEVIVDLFAGIGYFVLPFLVRAKAKLVYACEWNPHAVEALRHNLLANSVSDRCVILEGDNRIMAPKGVADRVCLGLLPTSEGSWVTAVRALRSEGGVLHLHGNVKDSDKSLWTKHVEESILEIAESEGRCWEVTVEHVERVKWYGPHIRHLVADVRCRMIQT